MKKVLSAMLLIFAINIQATIDCPSIEVIKSARVTDAKIEESYFGPVWAASSKGQYGSKMWDLTVPLAEHVNNKEEAIEIGNKVISLINQSLGQMSDKNGVHCSYACENSNSMVILTISHS